MAIEIKGIRENPEYLESGIDYFLAKLGCGKLYQQFMTIGAKGKNEAV